MMSLLQETPKSSSQNEKHSRYAKAMEKRKSALRKTIALDEPIAEDVEDDDDNGQTVPKNTNRNMYFANTLYKTMCALCNKTDKRLVQHYLKHHSNYEVLIARLSPAMADSIRQQNQHFDLHKSKISGICFFCEETKSSLRTGWQLHILTHTGINRKKCLFHKIMIK